jgi:hypothetical protein
MEDKLSYYDIVAHIVPGTLVLGVLALIPEVFGFTVPLPHSSVVTLAASIPVTYTIGQVVQALASFMQPVYYHLWGGMPSAVMLEGKSKRLHGARLDKVVVALSVYFHTPAETTEGRAALFSFAMALCNRNNLGRVDSFNASYAFHRALLTTGIVTTSTLVVAIALSGLGISSAASSIRPSLIYLAVLAGLLTVVEFVRARQRGEYFSVEVLDMAYIQSVEASATSGTNVEDAQ